MVKKKIKPDKVSRPEALLGFAARSGNLLAGYNTCLSLIKRRKARLVLLTEDVGENTKKKIAQKCAFYHISCALYGTADELGQATGKPGKGVFAVINQEFADGIVRAINAVRGKEEVADGQKDQ